MHPATPLIIKRQDHNLSRQLVNPNALRVLYRLKENNFAAFLVGGSVRDLMLGREPKDFDIVTDATPGQIKRLFRNCRLVGRRFRLAHIHFKGEVIEVATFRANAAEIDDDENGEPGDAGTNDAPPLVLKSEEGVLLRDNLFGSPEEDAWRRDFTVNALSYNIADFSIVDYVGGVSDLEQGIIRTIGDPETRLAEDPVRMLRAVRFAAQLGFTIEKECWQAMLAMAERIALAAPPRLFDEVLKLFFSGEGTACYRLLRQTGLFRGLFPFLDDWLERQEGDFPHTTLTEALLWTDRKVGAGEKPELPLFLALFFSGYLAEKGAAFLGAGASPQESVEMSVASLMEETAVRVLIPHRLGLRLRDILLLQLRFSRMPGRKPQSVVARPGFAEALEFLRFRASADPALEKTLRWWESFLGSNGQPPAAPADEGSSENPPRSRRRRRRRR